MAERKTFLGHFGPAVGLLLGIACGAITIGAFVAKPEGWLYVVIMFALITVAGAVWALLASRANRQAEERERAERKDERARNPEMVRCGEKEAGNPLFCGERVPVWFADLDDNGPPRCHRCMSGVPGGPYQLRYPKPRETEKEYSAEVKAMQDRDAAIADEYDRMMKDFPLPTDASAAHIAGSLEDKKLRVARDDGADIEEAQSEEETASKPAKVR